MKFILFQSQKSPRQFHNCTFVQIGNYSLILTFFLSLFLGEVPTFIAPSYPVIIEVRPTKILFSRLLPFIYGENLCRGGGGGAGGSAYSLALGIRRVNTNRTGSPVMVPKLIKSPILSLTSANNSNQPLICSQMV